MRMSFEVTYTVDPTLELTQVQLEELIVERLVVWLRGEPTRLLPYVHIEALTVGYIT